MAGRPIWQILLGLYLVIVGAITLASLTFEGINFVIGLSALIAGFALWFGK